MEIFKFLRSRNFKLLNKIKGLSIHYYDMFKIMISFRGHCCVYTHLRIHPLFWLMSAGMCQQYVEIPYQT